MAGSAGVTVHAEHCGEKWLGVPARIAISLYADRFRVPRLRPTKVT